ncbi:MAG: hypothetical protein KUG65_06005 [Sphingomonadaceae bacterium]|nr:hypothetical protein [Sphingomonadaceae bacterium]
MIAAASINKAAGFYLPWLAAAAVAAQEPASSGNVTVIALQGIELPVLQLVLAIAGVLMARPLAPRRNPPLGWLKSIIVTVIMLIVAVGWVADARPGVLFTFVVSIGLGFSGYTLIEQAGTEIENFFRRIFSLATGALGSSTGKDR